MQSDSLAYSYLKVLQSVQMIFDVIIKREGQNHLCDVLFDYFSYMLICWCSAAPKNLWLNRRNRRNFMRDDLHNHYYFHQWSTGNYVRRAWELVTIECFHSRDQWACFSTKTKENVIRIEFNSWGSSLGHKHGPRDVTWKHFVCFLNRHVGFICGVDNIVVESLQCYKNVKGQYMLLNIFTLFGSHYRIHGHPFRCRLEQR